MSPTNAWTFNDSETGLGVSKIRQVLPEPLEIFSANPLSFKYLNAVLIGFVFAVDGKPPYD